MEEYLSGKIDLEKLKRVIGAISWGIENLERAIQAMTDSLGAMVERLAKAIEKIESEEGERKLYRERSRTENKETIRMAGKYEDKRNAIRALRRERKPP